ncbi:MAG: hypothetical protein R2825_14245 [Saprospiraceae bacterium]
MQKDKGLSYKIKTATNLAFNWPFGLAIGNPNEFKGEKIGKADFLSTLWRGGEATAEFFIRKSFKKLLLLKGFHHILPSLLFSQLNKI